MASPAAGLVSYSGFDGSRKRTPYIGAPEEEITNFLLRQCNFYSTYRNHHMARYARNLWYYLGRQWIHLDHEILQDEVRGFVFKDLAKGMQNAPRPVTNFIGPACDNEISRLGNREFIAKVLCDSDDPMIMAGAKLGDNVLRHHFKQVNWDDKREAFIQLLVVCGFVGLRSGWDTPITETRLVGSPDAVGCPNCKAKLTEPRIPREMTNRFQLSNTQTIRDDEEDQDQVRLSHCPNCSGPVPLLKYDLEQEEAEMERDYFGRPLGWYEPKGKPILDVIDPFSVFPENGGVGKTPYNLKKVARACPVSTDWIEERYPEKCDELFAAEPTFLMKTHPILGEWNYLGRYNVDLDSGIYDNDMMLYEACVDPYVEKVTEELIEASLERGIEIQGDVGDYVPNDGRYILAVGDDTKLVVLDDGPLLVPYETHDGKERKLRRVTYAFSQYKRRPGEIWSDGLPDIGISPQNRINGRDGQWIQAVDRMGSPNLLVPDDIELRGPEWREEGGGKIMGFTRSIQYPEAKPEVLEGATLPNEVWAERDRMKTDLQDLMNWQRVERGDNPKNVKNTSQLKLLGDNADAHRGPMERGIGLAIETVAGHTLEMFYALRTEKDTYTVDAKGQKSSAIHYFRGADLMKQTTVKVEKSAGVRGDIYTSEAASEALEQQVYDLSDPVARKKFLELRDLPEINEAVNRQIERAQEVGIDFVERGKVYSVDPTLHEPLIWYKVLGNFWFDDKIIQRQRDARWDEDVLPAIAGWDQQLAALAEQELMAQQAYGNVPFEQQMMMYEDGIEQQKQALIKSKIAADDAIAADLPPEPPPQLAPVPQPVNLPKAQELRIYQLWCEMLQLEPTEIDPEVVQAQEEAQEALEAEGAGALGIGLQQDPTEITLHRLLRYRAVIEAYRLASEAKAMAPAAAAAPDGSMPEEGQEAVGAPAQKSSNQQGPQMPTGPMA